jgi:hypothetical protein
MKNFLYIISLLIIPAVASAQVPGYQGKRFSVEGDFFFMSALFNPNQNAKKVFADSRFINPNNNNSGYYNYNYDYNSNTEPSFKHVHPESFNTRYNLSVSYVVSRVVSLELTGGIFTTGWNRKFSETATTTTIDPYYGNSTTTTTHGQYSDLYKVEGAMAGMNIKFFRRDKGAIAPNGSYFKVGASYINSTPTYVGAYDNNGYGYSQSRATATGMVLFTCGLGKQTIFYDRLLLKYGVEFGMSPLGISRVLADLESPTDSYSNSGTTSTVEETGYTLNERVLFQNLVNIQLGIGLLLF